MIRFFIQALFKIKIQPNMSDQEMKREKNLICLTPKPSQSFFVYRIQRKEKNY